MKIGWIGLGAMGSRMAARLVDGHDVRVYNRDASRVAPLVEAGARAASSPREAAEGADVVVSMVTGDEASAAVWLGERGALGGLGASAIAVECSTISVAWARELGAAIGDRFVEAPVVGSTPQAETGALLMLMGGGPRARAALAPIGERLAGRVVALDAGGASALTKLAINALFASQVALLAEILEALEAHGLASSEAIELLSSTPVWAPALSGAAGLMLAGDEASRFPIALVAKDLEYAGALGRLPVVEAARARYERARDEGLGDLNLTALYKSGTRS